MVVLAIACALQAGAAEPSAPVLDQVAWLRSLQEARPALMKQHVGAVTDPAWLALVLRPQYRAELLSSPTATYATIVAREYSSEEMAADTGWAQDLRDAQRAFVPTARVQPARYPLEIYTGYAVGEAFAPDADNLLYKAFLELADGLASLAPDRYLAFVARLDAHGFVGDSKIDLRPGSARFQYNNVIVHAPTPDMARCAEWVGREVFGSDLLHTGRGVDVYAAPRPLDWHHFLLTGGFHQLPAHARAFVQERDPASASACPH